MTLPLIGITGAMGSGKDSAAAHLVQTYDCERYAFADAIRTGVAMALDSYDCPLGYAGILDYMAAHKRDEGGWVRPLLQSWGIAHRDLYGADYWLRHVPLRPGVVISDVRFADEADAIHNAGGLVWRITRPGCNGDGHATEVEVSTLTADAEIANDGTLADLYAALDSLVAAVPGYVDDLVVDPPDVFHGPTVTGQCEHCHGLITSDAYVLLCPHCRWLRFRADRPRAPYPPKGTP